MMLVQMGRDVSQNLRDAGFEGFHTIEELRSVREKMPQVRGVYVLLRTSSTEPTFRSVGSGGHFKGKDPNVDLEVLDRNWVTGTEVMYIGKAGDPGSAATLRSRLHQYWRFGSGANVGHWGGRYIWQLSDAEQLRVCWLTLPDGHPSQVESTLIDEFRRQHGVRPFANLTK